MKETLCLTNGVIHSEVFVSGLVSILKVVGASECKGSSKFEVCGFFMGDVHSKPLQFEMRCLLVLLKSLGWMPGIIQD